MSKTKKLTDLLIKASEMKVSDYSDIRSSGIIPLDIALRCGGYKKGRIVEIYGEEHSGKTLICLSACIEDQKLNPKAKYLFIDAEGSFDMKWYEALGGDLDRMFVYDPYTISKQTNIDIHGEEVYDNVIDLIGTGEYSIAVLDSFMGAALLSKEILNKELDDTQRLGVQAKLNNGFVKRAFLQTMKTDTTFLITNHLMEKIGVSFGNPETTPGGKLLKFYAEQRIRVGKPQEKTIEGQKIQGGIVKNKRGSSAGQKFDAYLSFNKGIDNFMELAKMMIKHDVIEKKEKQKYADMMRNDIKLYQKYKQELLEMKRTGKEMEIEEVEEEIFEELTDG